MTIKLFRPRGSMRGSFAVVLFLTMASSAPGVNVTSSWFTVSDDWTNSSRWSNVPLQLAYPNNGADTYDANISAASGTPYSVTVHSPITINNLNLTSPAAELYQYDASTVLTINNTFNLSAGTYRLVNGAMAAGTLTLAGGTLQLLGGTLTPGNVTLNGSTVIGGSITGNGAGHLTVMNNGNNILDGVTLPGGITLDQANGRVRLINDANFNGFPATLDAAGTVLAFETTATDTTASISDSTINMDGANGRIGIEGISPVLTLSPTAVLRGRGTVTFSTGFFSSSNTQLVNQGTISADLAGQTLTLSPHSISNTGTARAVNGGTLTISPLASFTNATGGILSATGGSTLVMRQNWHNLGSLVLQDTSVISFEGTFTTADLGISSWSRSGGTVNVVGTLNNTGAALDFNAIGSFALAGGSIIGGTISNSATGRLIITNNNSNVLDAVTVTGGLTLDTNSHLRLRNDTTFTGNIDFAAGSVIGFEATATDSTIVLANTTLNLNSNNYISLEGAAPSLTLAPTATMRGYGTVTQNFFGGGTITTLLDNQGLISADVPGQNLSLSTYTITNSGTMRAIGGGSLYVNPITSFTNSPGGTLSVTGGSTLTLQKNWHNQGTLVLQDTSVVWMLGTFTTADLGLAGWSRTGGTVNVAGTLNNTGATLSLNASTGNLTLAGGTITGGTLENSTGGRLVITNNSANVLDGVTVNGGLVFSGSSSQVRLRNDCSISGTVDFTTNSNSLFLEGTAADNTIVLASKLTLNLDGSNPGIYLMGLNPSATFTSSLLVRGRGLIANSSVTGTSQLINQGRIVADISGQTLTISPNSLTNTGSIETMNGGILNIPSSLMNQSAGTIRLGGGYLQVTGSQSGPDMTLGTAARLEGFGEVRLANFSTDSLSLSGTVAPDFGAGGLAIKGDLVPTSSAVFSFDIAGTTQGTSYDFVSETGSTALDLAGSTLQISVAGGYAPPNAQTFTIIGSTQTITGQFGNVASGARVTSTDGLWTFLVTRAGSAITLSDAQPSPAAAYITFMKAAFRGSTDPALIGPFIDPDLDGTPNLLEFALKGDPDSPGDHGLMAELFQDVAAAPGDEFTLVIAFRQGAVFTAQPDGSQKNVTAVDSVHCTVQGSETLSTFTLPVLHVGPSVTAPAATALPDLTGSGWEYHTFYLDPTAITSRGFMRVVVDGGP